MSVESAWVFWMLYGVATVATALGSVAFWGPRWARTSGIVLLLVAVGGFIGTLGSRWMIAGRPPVIGTFENTLVTATLIVAVAVAVACFGPPTPQPPLPGLIAPWALVVLAGGSLAIRTPLPIDAGGRTLIGYFHALVGWLDFALLVGSFAAAIGLLLCRRAADDAAWDEALTRLLGLGFALLTLTIASGSVYSFILFGEWYRWQIVETASAVAWLACATLLHLRLLHRWQGRRLAVATLVAFLITVPAFWIWAVYPTTYHYFDAVLRLR